MPSFLSDLLLGDPEHRFHSVRIIRGLMWESEWRLYPKAGPLVAAFWNKLFLWFCCVGAVSTGVPLLTAGLRGVFFPLGSLFEILLPYRPSVVRCLQDSAERVARILEEEGLAVGRKVVSYIVGRNTEALGKAGAIRATVETIARSASDGEVVPLFCLLLFSVTGDWVCKTMNTMDSMLDYKNVCYKLSGRITTRMDNAFNWIPARVAALLLIAAAAIVGQDARETARVFRRDRYRHASPNSAQTESMMVGTLRVRLAGPASYSGEYKEKPYIGDAGREIEAKDIAWANRMPTAASWLSLLFLLALRFFCRAITTKLAASLQSTVVLPPLLFQAEAYMQPFGALLEEIHRVDEGDKFLELEALNIRVGKLLTQKVTELV